MWAVPQGFDDKRPNTEGPSAVFDNPVLRAMNASAWKVFLTLNQLTRVAVHTKRFFCIECICRRFCG